MDIYFDKKLLDHIRFNENDAAMSMLNRELARAHDDFGTLLHHAAFHDNIVIAQHLIDLGSDIEALGQENRTPLMVAIRYPKVASVKFFLEAGANIYVKDANGESILQRVFNNNHFKVDMVQFFCDKLRVEAGSTENLVDRLKKNGCTLHHALKFNDFDLMESMLKSGVDIDARQSWNELTALHAAVKQNNLKSVKWLVTKGADVNAGDRHGSTALMLAAVDTNKTIMEFLLKAGADPNPKNSYSEETPLYTLARYRYDRDDVFECMELLLRCGAVPHNPTRLYEDSIFDAALESVDPARAGYLMSHLVLCEKNGTPIDIVRCKIQENKAELAQCYEECEQILETVMFQKLTLLDLLTDSDFKMRTYARNEAFAPRIQEVCAEWELNNSYPYYHNMMMKRVDKAVNTVQLEVLATEIISGFFNGTGNEYYIAARKVVDYLDLHELEELLKV